MIYLDCNATTWVDGRVLEAVLPYLRERFGNAASSHPAGRAARAVVDEAQEQVAALLGTRARSVVWTSGATEALNTVLKGLVAATSGRRRLVYAATEHKAVLDTVEHLAEVGLVEAVSAPVDAEGRVEVEALRALVDEETLAVCVMAANNETGVVNDVAAVAELAHERGALLVCDATQQAGKLPVDLTRAGVDYAAVSGHKLYAPQGVGALVVKPVLDGPDLVPLVHGGGHQRGLRSGTLNVPGIVGFGTAAQIAESELEAEARRLGELRDRLEALLDKHAGPVTVHSLQAVRLPNTTNVRVHDVDADALLANCPEVAMSSGSACTAAVPAPSHVLRAMGLATEQAEESVRLSLGRFTTAEEVEQAAELIGQAAARVREVNG